MARNVLYEDNDVKVMMIGGEGMEKFLADAKEKVQKFDSKKSKDKDKKQNKFDADMEFENFDYYRQYGMYEQYGMGGHTWNI